ncbi:MAG TPA: hypothetical protein VJQ57_09275 [Acidimicrobiia bacterium]|nr:hypothetical protein [Acidimicrobiia bacterium]
MDEFDDGATESEESGGQLRKKLEAQIAKNKELTAELRKFAAKDLISAKGFKHVKPDDLVGVKPDDLEEKAAEIEEAKVKEQETILRNALVDRGIPEDEIEQRLADLTGDTNAQARQAAARVTELSRTPGTPVSRGEQQGVFGADRLAQVFGPDGKRTK